MGKWKEKRKWWKKKKLWKALSIVSSILWMTNVYVGIKICPLWPLYFPLWLPVYRLSEGNIKIKSILQTSWVNGGHGGLWKFSSAKRGWGMI